MWCKILFFPIIRGTLLWHCYTHPADHSGCVRWHKSGECCVDTHAKLPHTLSLYVFAWKKWLGPWRCLYLGDAVRFVFSFFFSSDVSHGLPQLFYQVILSGRQPRTAALFILCYGDWGNRKSRPPLWWHAKKGERLNVYICCHLGFPSCCDHQAEHRNHKWDCASVWRGCSV